MAKKKCLIVFDFDNTVVNANTDVVVQDIPTGTLPLPGEVNKVKNQGWTAFMQAVFKHHHGNGVKEEDYYEKLDEIPFVPGVREMIEILAGPEYNNFVEMIIVSDANSVFIDRILGQNGLSEFFSTVVTNPAEFEDSGLLRVTPYRRQDHCALSAANLCKGDAVDEYVKKRKEEGGIEFVLIGYAGDGDNDLCPMVRLPEGSLLFPRDGYRIVNSLENYSSSEGAVRGTKVPWTNGGEMLAALETKMKACGLVKSE